MAKSPHDPRPRPAELAALDGVPLDLLGWIARNMSGDLGPVGNREVFRHSDFIFMIVKGPNARNDFHIDPYDEIFYQLQGSVQVELMGTDGRLRTAEVRQGEVMIVQAHTPHSPRRPPGSLGLVVERPRTAGEQDGIVWYCERCGATLHEVYLRCEDIETQLKAELDRFNDTLALRTCKDCGAVLPDPRQTPPWQAAVKAASDD